MPSAAAIYRQLYPLLFTIAEMHRAPSHVSTIYRFKAKNILLGHDTSVTNVDRAPSVAFGSGLRNLAKILVIPWVT